jgi:molybdenum cofactor cytidylyltransferase
MLGTVILAAGRSLRMGRPKPLLPWGKTTVIGHLISQWQDLGATLVAVVCASGDEAILIELDRIEFPAEQRIINPAPEHGMFSSIQASARWGGWSAGLTHWAIALGDQPHLPAKTLRKMMEFSAAHPENICVPLQGGHRRHPVWLPRKAFLEIASSNAADLKAFLDYPPVAVQLCELTDAALELDIDHPEDYEEAKRLYLREQEDRRVRARCQHKKQ